MKVLSGVHKPDTGEILFEDRLVTIDSPRDALALGIAIVHQELSLVPALSIAENIFPGRQPLNALGMVRYRKLYSDAAAVLQELDLDLDPRTPVSDLSIAKQQMIEIAKALSFNCKVLILDEPTSALTEREVETLFVLLRRLAANGVGLLYISHKLDEVFRLTDRITVLRDGKYIDTVDTSSASPQDIVRMMVGRQIDSLYPPKGATRGEPILDVRDLQLRHQHATNSFSVHRGEIIGFAGLIGSGRTELCRAIFGADPYVSGQIYLEDKAVQIHSPADAIRHQIGYLPEDRKAAGLFLDMAIKQNTTAANLSAVSSMGFMRPRKEKALAEQYIEQLDIVTSGADQEVRRLSGGNQQKTLLAKWLAIAPKVFMVDEPTRGVDVGAKSEIHHLLRRLADQGVAIIMVSSELPEIIGMSDRIFVMHEGRIAGELSVAEATQERIMQIASGQIERAESAPAQP